MFKRYAYSGGGNMDCNKIGNLIYTLRKEKSLTQKHLAEAMQISDKTISKWERGLGCPDISLLKDLSELLNVNLEQMLTGKLTLNSSNLGGNIQKINFYICSVCGNIITSISETKLSCCGRKLHSLIAKAATDTHKITISSIENDYYLTYNHQMTKDHYLTFIAYVTYDKILLTKLYPEQASEVRFPKLSANGTIYFACSKHGLWKTKILISK